MTTIFEAHLLPTDQIPWPSVVRAVLWLIGIYTVYGAIWRLYLTPVAHIPGPWFAKLTFWNEFYYDVICGGQYTWQLEKYHAKYGEWYDQIRLCLTTETFPGPLIRINPYEVHILDKDFIDELYVGHSKRKSNKWAWAVSQSKIRSLKTQLKPLRCA